MIDMSEWFNFGMHINLATNTQKKLLTPLGKHGLGQDF